MDRIIPIAVVLACCCLMTLRCSESTSEVGQSKPEPQAICQEDRECSTGQSCLAGICTKRCSRHLVCQPREFCSQQGFCETGCRSSVQCAGDEHCVDGRCLNTEQHCNSRDDCGPGLVCDSGECVTPPELCYRLEDCPDDLLCDGFRHLCFDPDRQCYSAADCRDEVGCELGCICQNQECVVATQDCSLASEQQDCGNGAICHEQRCMATPVCDDSPSCAYYGLVCNQHNRVCHRSIQCVEDRDCLGQAPATYCKDSKCIVPTCLNGGVTCVAPEECAGDGYCRAPVTSGCRRNVDCCPDDLDNNQTCASGLVEYCDSGDPGECRQGCRDGSDCGDGKTCNALHRCVEDQTGGGDGDPCATQEDCRAGYFCGLISYVCFEECTDIGSICPETGKTCTLYYWVTVCMD